MSHLLFLATLTVAHADDSNRHHHLKTEAGALDVHAAGHGTLRLDHGETTLWVDPWSKADMTIGGDGPVQVVLITDIHGDHLDPAALAGVVSAKTHVVAPRAVVDALKEKGSDIQVDTVLSNGATTTVEGISIEAVPMYNNTRGPEPGTLFHEKGRGNGYLLTVGGKRVYIAGDTACTPEMKALTDIDLAFIPMNLPYTMPPDEAATCVKAFAPDAVIPYHYRGQDTAVFADALKGTSTAVHLLEFYAP